MDNVRYFTQYGTPWNLKTYRTGCCHLYLQNKYELDLYIHINVWFLSVIWGTTIGTSPTISENFKIVVNVALSEFKTLEDHFIIYKSDIDEFFSYVILEYLKNFEPQINQKVFAEILDMLQQN